MASSKTWEWLRRGELKKETEGLITAAQDQSLRTNVMKARIEKSYVQNVQCGGGDCISHCQRMQSACSDGVQRQTRQVSQGDPLGYVLEVRCQGAIEVVRPCAGKGRRNRPCQDSLGLQHPDRSCYRT